MLITMLLTKKQNTGYNNTPIFGCIACDFKTSEKVNTMEFLRIKNKKYTTEISQLFNKTFTDSEGQDEGALIGALAYDFLTCTDKKDLYVFATMVNGKIIGSIMFSRLTFEKSTLNAFLLAPVAVATDYQGKGIGQKLISFGHKELEKDGVQLVITYGDINFYSKVGYQSINEDRIPAPLPLTYPEGWLAQSLAGDTIEPIAGTSYCVEEIHKPQYW